MTEASDGEEVTPEMSREYAIWNLAKAIERLTRGDAEHAVMRISDALIWARRAAPSPEGDTHG